MTLHAAMDFTPIEKYDTTEEQKLYAAFHAVGRVPNEDLPEILAMFGLIDIAPEPLPADTIYCIHGHPLTEDNIRPSNRGGKPACRTCERNSRTGENR